jgi:hypothetical protein
VFQYDFDHTGNWTNGVGEVRLALALDCRSKAGDVVIANLEETSCS